jgi:hypothetical protein
LECQNVFFWRHGLAVTQPGLELLGSSSLPVSISQIAGTTGVHQHQVKTENLKIISLVSWSCGNNDLLSDCHLSFHAQF